MQIDIPELCLVLLVGASGAGPGFFASRHFRPSEIVSLAACRAALADDEHDESATDAAFDLMHAIVAQRLQRGRLTVVDAPIRPAAPRQRWIALAKQYHVSCVAFVFDRTGTLQLEREGCRFVHLLKPPEQAQAATLIRTPLQTDLSRETGPFDIVGDVHGCFDELMDLLQALGYAATRSGDHFDVQHPAGRRLVFVGDLVDRGPNTPDVIRLVRSAVQAGMAFCVAGNHDAKLARALQGRTVKVAHGLERSLEQLASTPDGFRKEAAEFLDDLQSHYVMDGGKLVVAHAGLTEDLQGRSSGRVRSFAMYGDTTGETDEFGLPVRVRWAEQYRGSAMVVYGHTPVLEAGWLNHTLCVDTGCVFGGKLTALRYPERDLVSVPARREHYPPARPLAIPPSTG